MVLQIKMNMAENGVQASRSMGNTSLDSTALDARDIAAFAGMLEEDSDEAQECTASTSMAALLASMNGALQASMMQNTVASVVTETTSVTAPHFTAEEIDAMVTMLVDRISMTDAKAHMVTVEVSLADTALCGTTMHLTRSLDGLFAVNIMTNNAAIFQTLVGAQIDLRTKLESLDLGMVRVDIFHKQQEQEREQNRHSAMYQEYLGDDEHA